jgi:hypothetical protein
MLPFLDRGDDLTLAHPASTDDAQRLGEPLQIRQQHRRQRHTYVAGRASRHWMRGLTSTGVRIWPGAYRAVRRGGSPGMPR